MQIDILLLAAVASPSDYLQGFQPMDIVWAKSPVASSYIPALIVDPTQKVEGVKQPPEAVMAKRPRHATIPWVLLAYFDIAENW